MEEKNTSLIKDEMSERIIAAAEELVLTVGAEKITVRRILQKLSITNRVFYNRFHNINDVLNTVYENTVLKIRESITAKFDPKGDFFSQVIDIVAGTLIMSYEVKMNFNTYVFENDSVSQDNYQWWKEQIINLIEFGKKQGHLKNIDSEAMAYAVWCFIRGYNADALGRKLPRDEAVRNFKYSFGILLDGMRA
ncbi:MAG: TetR/AcrR family transcriptional regulator [Ruminococcaceae bacterium]|nr:TetR/AcrR family transcriptional regulator [Oscillospiraceae bacterium]